MTIPRRHEWTWVVIGAICGSPVVGWCAQATPERKRPPSGRAVVAAQLLRALDRNQDGMLQTEEIPPRVRLQVALAARQRGLDPGRPLPLAELTRPINSPPPASAAKAKPPATKAPPESKQKPESARRSDRTLPTSVPGFGVPDDRPPVPGFEVPAPAAAAIQADGSAKSRAGKRSSASKPSVSARVRRYAKSMLAQYDKNKNGQLEKEEWSRVRRRLEKADRNADGVLTLDELTSHLAGYAGRRGAPEVSGAAMGRRALHHANKSDGARRNYRFRPAHARLPKGLPDWFVGRDADRDGQVAMSEYSATWTHSKVEEFARLDLNGDGFIVPKECLRATAGQQ